VHVTFLFIVNHSTDNISYTGRYYLNVYNKFVFINYLINNYRLKVKLKDDNEIH